LEELNWCIKVRNLNLLYDDFNVSNFFEDKNTEIEFARQPVFNHASVP
jgi:hypothetical protein